MTEPSWANAAERNRRNAAELYNGLSDPVLEAPELPAAASPASNPALNRSAETVGRSLGNAVAGARNLPRQIDKLRSRIHLVPGREAVASSASHLKESALETAAEWRDAAENKAEELKQRVEPYINAATERTNRRVDELRLEARRRINSLRRSARERLAKARHLGEEQPLAVIGACAATAFVLGIVLRVRRSNCD